MWNARERNPVNAMAVLIRVVMKSQDQRANNVCRPISFGLKPGGTFLRPGGTFLNQVGSFLCCGYKVECNLLVPKIDSDR